MINPERIPRDVIVIGASAGGVEALIHLFSTLPAQLPAIIAVVIHRSPMYNLHLSTVLGRHATMPVREPETNESLTAGTIYLAPRDHHIAAERQAHRAEPRAQGTLYATGGRSAVCVRGRAVWSAGDRCVVNGRRGRRSRRSHRDQASRRSLSGTRSTRRENADDAHERVAL